jgi:hypothetical protein
VGVEDPDVQTLQEGEVRLMSSNSCHQFEDARILALNFSCEFGYGSSFQVSGYLDLARDLAFKFTRPPSQQDVTPDSGPNGPRRVGEHCRG